MFLLHLIYTPIKGVQTTPAHPTFTLLPPIRRCFCEIRLTTVWCLVSHTKDFVGLMTAAEFQRMESKSRIRICVGCSGSSLATVSLWFTAVFVSVFLSGFHVVQWMYGCEWDEETDKVNGYQQFGYDGEDFIIFDLKEQTWVTAKQQAVITKQKWDHDWALTTQKKNYLTQICPEGLKKYVNYGRSSLMKTDVPKVSLLQKSSSSPVTCHATGFYPNRAEMFWRKDGVEFHEGVNKGEILTNNDGTFQMSVDLDVSSVTPEDWDRYRCVFQLSGVNEDIVTRLDKSEIRTNEGNNLTIIIAIFAVVLVLGAVTGFIVYKKKTSERKTKKIIFS
uniref:Ig-like domain-containing protein n=1 Tax=Haplochromis burtoni TaxID=8153 RepID=A0A3Q2WYF1_HAPBU